MSKQGYERRKRINGQKRDRQVRAAARREDDALAETYDDLRAQFYNDVAADAREVWGQA